MNLFIGLFNFQDYKSQTALRFSLLYLRIFIQNANIIYTITGDPKAKKLAYTKNKRIRFVLKPIFSPSFVHTPKALASMIFFNTDIYTKIDF